MILVFSSDSNFRLRLARGLSQEELADAAHLDRTYLRSCERGKWNIGLLNIHSVAGALGVSANELLRPPRKRSPAS